MWKLSLPHFNEAMNDLGTALTFKDGSRKHTMSQEETEIISQIWADYEANCGVPNDNMKGLALPKDTRKAIYEAYNEVQENGRLKHLRDRLLINVGHCPFCGISSADELDHYLPRSIFNPLSVYSSNLVPICHKCNNKKRTVTGVNPSERFAHAYYDDIPLEVQFLIPIITVENDKMQVLFSIKKLDEIDDLLHQQLSFQIERINLNERLQKAVNDFMFSFIGGLELAYEGGSEGVQKFLQKSAEGLQKKIGLNHWRTVLLFGLAKIDSFCDGGFIQILGSTQ